MTIRLKRAYAPAAEDDGYRVLVDRLWPRGLRRDQLKLDAWLRDLAPSTALRRWFQHEPDRWPELRQRYFGELAEQQELVANLAARAGNGQVTLIYAAKDDLHNNAVALKEYLEQTISASIS
jgi:uncharacterized protein YeaO (DUF488 family)